MTHETSEHYLFPSIQMNGTHPAQPDMILKRHIRPALERMGVQKIIGWHSCRHGLANMPWQKGLGIKPAQELLRQANSRIALDIHQQSVSQEKRTPQNLAFKGL